MSDLISKKALIDTMSVLTWYRRSYSGELFEGAHNKDDAVYKAADVFKAINVQSTVDAVPVVRCKDCKHYQAQDPTRPTTCAVGLEDNCADDYCSRGERREDG